MFKASLMASNAAEAGKASGSMVSLMQNLLYDGRLTVFH